MNRHVELSVINLVLFYAFMRQNSKNNHADILDDESALRSLATALQRITKQKMQVQQAIERATGVDQTTISRAKNGKLQRITEKVRRLIVYANMQTTNIQLSGEIKKTAKSFLAAGGTEEELVASIQHATSLVLRHTKSK